MTAIPLEPDSEPVVQKKRGRKSSTDIPRIDLVSWPGAESILWAGVIAHLVKWAVSFAYFALFQVRYAVGYGKTTFTVVYFKDAWDRLPVHIANLLGEPWFQSQAEPLWWITWRHDIRDVGISVIATIIVRFLFVKPKYPLADAPGWKVYLTSVPLAIALALIPIAIVGVAAWKLPWLTQHGLHVGGSSAYAAEANGWIEAGEWITILMGVLGGFAASLAIQRVADDVQWFFAERSAGKIMDKRRRKGLTGISLTGGRVIGTPAHRKRVHWILDNRPEVTARSPWLVRTLLGVGFLATAFSIAGAWLNLAGPAKPK